MQKGGMNRNGNGNRQFEKKRSNNNPGNADDVGKNIFSKKSSNNRTSNSTDNPFNLVAPIIKNGLFGLSFFRNDQQHQKPEHSDEVQNNDDDYQRKSCQNSNCQRKQDQNLSHFQKEKIKLKKEMKMQKNQMKSGMRNRHQSNINTSLNLNKRRPQFQMKQKEIQKKEKYYRPQKQDSIKYDKKESSNQSSKYKRQYNQEKRHQQEYKYKKDKQENIISKTTSKSRNPPFIQNVPTKHIKQNNDLIEENYSLQSQQLVRNDMETQRQNQNNSGQPQDQFLNNQRIKINLLKQQIRIIKLQSNLNGCIQIYIRQIQLALIEDNFSLIIFYANELQKQLKKYQLDNPKNLQLIQEIKMNFPYAQKKGKIVSIKNTFGLNMISLQKLISKIQQLDFKKYCDKKNALVFIGTTGSGKTTCFIGLQGYKLKYQTNSLTNSQEYIPQDPQIHQKYKVSSSMFSITSIPNIQIAPRNWTYPDQIILVDMAGFEDNRGSETDIINNLCNINIMNSLQSVRIILVLSKQKFYVRCYDQIKKLIKLLSNYLKNAFQFKDSLQLILTKGLQKKYLIGKITQFVTSQQYQRQNWTENQKQIIRILQFQCDEIKQFHQIKKPHLHDYKRLLKQIIKKESTYSPGSYIQSSYSQNTLRSINCTYQYLKNIIKRTIQLNQLKKGFFYLQLLQQLEIISRRNLYESTIIQIRKLFNEKKNKTKNILRILQNSTFDISEDIKELKQIDNFFTINEQIQQLKTIIFSNDQNYLGKTHKQLIQDFHKFTINLFSQYPQLGIQKHQRGNVGLIMLNSFNDKNSYEEILQKIQTNEKNLQQRLKLYLQQQFHINQFNNLVKKYINKFIFNKNNNIKDNYNNNKEKLKVKVRQIILNYHPIQHVRNFLTKIDQNFKDNIIQDNCIIYLWKFQQIQSNNIFDKLFANQMKAVLQLLENTFNNLQVLLYQFDSNGNGDIYKYQIYSNNLEIIKNILQKYHDCNLKRQSKSQMVQKSSLNKILIKNQQKIRLILEQIKQNNQDINIQIANNIKQLFKFIHFIKRKISQLRQDEQKNKNMINLLTILSKKNLNVINDMIKNIRITIMGIQITENKVNTKLLFIMMVLKLIKQQDLDQMPNIQSDINLLQPTILEKIKIPLKQIQNLKFKNLIQFKTLFQVLEYYKQLNNKINEFRILQHSFNIQNTILQQNQLIKKSIIKCFEEINQYYNGLNVFNQLYEIYEKEQHLPNQYSINQEQQKVIFINYELSKDTIAYIKIFEIIKNIVQSYSNQLSQIRYFKETDYSKLNLKQKIIKIVQKYYKKIVNNQNNNIILGTNRLYLVQKVIKICRMIFVQTDNLPLLNQQNILTPTIEKIKVLIQNNTTQFEIKINNFKQQLSNLQIEIKFNQFQIFITKIDKNNKLQLQKVQQLIQLINNLAQQLLLKYYLNYEPDCFKVIQKNYLFLNIFQFIRIVQKNQIIMNFQKIQNILNTNLNNFYQNLNSAYNQLIKAIKKGDDSNKQSQHQLINIQRKFQLILTEKYNQFRRNYQIDQSFSYNFNTQRVQFRRNNQQKYFSERDMVLDQYLGQFYQNCSQDEKKIINKNINERYSKKIHECSQLLKSDHLQFQKQYQIFKQDVNYLPRHLKQKYEDQFNKLLDKKRLYQESQMNNIQQLNPTQILQKCQESIRINNIKVYNFLKGVLQNYLNFEIQKIHNHQIQSLSNGIKCFNKIKINQINKFQFLIQLITKYENIIKNLYNSNSQKFKQNLQKYKQKQYNNNKIQNFNIHSYNSFEQEQIKIKNIYQALKHLQIEFNQIITIDKKASVKNFLSQYIYKVFQQLKNDIQILRQTQRKMQNLSNQSNLKAINVKQFIKDLRSAYINNNLCIFLYEEFRNQILQELTQQYFVQFNEVIKNIILKLEQIRNKILLWNLQEFLKANFKQIIIKQFNLIVIKYNILIGCYNVCFHTQQNLNVQDFIKTVIETYTEQGNNLQNKIISIIKNFRKNQNQQQNLQFSKFYIFTEILNQNRNIKFPINFDAQVKLKSVRQLIIEQFKIITHQVKKILQKKQFFNQLANLQKKINQIKHLQNNKIEQKTNEYHKKLQKIKQQKLKFQNRQIKSVLQDNQNRDQQIENIIIRCQSEIQTQNNRLLVQQQNQKQLIHTQKKIQIQQNKNKIKQIIQQNIINPIIMYKRFIFWFSCQKKINDESNIISSTLQNLNNKNSKGIIKYLFQILNNSDNKFYFDLINQQKVFKNLKNKNFLQSTNNQKFQQVLKKTLFNQSQKTQMETKYKNFIENFNNNLKQYSNSTDRKYYYDNLIKQTIIFGQRQVKRTYETKLNNNNFRVELLAKIIAIGCIYKSTIDEENEVTYDFKPHPGQIITLFLLLEFDKKNLSQQIKKTIVQVSTGEGKSIVLGFLSVYFALCEFNVYIACYSPYLCNRDQNDFYDLFRLFKIQNKIKYDIFSEICALILDSNPESNFKSNIEKILMKSTLFSKIKNYLNKLLQKSSTQKNILIYDEVDKVLELQYLGQSYRPSINIKTDVIRKFFDFVWENQQISPKNLYRLLSQSWQFKQILKINNNKEFQKLMENQLHGIIKGLLSYKNDKYTIKEGDDKIYYKQGDGLSNIIHHGYKTIFSYYYECKVTKRIDQSQLNNQVGINLIIATFSYSKLPLYFKTILGVSGTVDSLSSVQKKIMKQTFKIDRTFIQPSIFTESNKQINFIRCLKQNKLKKLIEILQKVKKQNRPILVFLQTLEQIYETFNNQQFKNKFGNLCQILTFENQFQKRNQLINKYAIKEGWITLLTSDYKRGIDFKYKVKNKKQHKGLHVISTYLPESYSDYVQLIGRTGRMGYNGSVDIFYTLQQNQKDIEETVLTRQQGQQMIKKIQQQKWNSSQQIVQYKIKSEQAAHEKSMQLFTNRLVTQDQIIRNIYEQNKQQVYHHPILQSKTAICIDGTYSMRPVFNKLIEVITQTLPIIKQTIQKGNLNVQFYIKFVVYRNYDVSQCKQLLLFSQFSNNPSILSQWLSNIIAQNGWGNQALQVCLQYLNLIQNLNTFVVISDAPANTNYEVKQRRKRKTTLQWNNHGFIQTNYEKQLIKLKQKDVKGYAYYIKPQKQPEKTQTFYNQMASELGGQSKQFLINRRNANELFADYISSIILANISDLSGVNIDEIKNIYNQISATRKRHISK